MKPKPKPQGAIMLGHRRGWMWYRVERGHIQLVPPREPRPPRPAKAAAA